MSWLTHAIQAVLSLWILLFQWINLYLLCNIKPFISRSSLWRGKSIMKYNNSGLNAYKHTVLFLRSKHFPQKSWKKLHLVIPAVNAKHVTTATGYSESRHAFTHSSYQCTMRNTFTRGSCRVEYVGNHNLLLWSQPENASSCAIVHQFLIKTPGAWRVWQMCYTEGLLYCFPEHGNYVPTDATFLCDKTAMLKAMTKNTL